METYNIIGVMSGTSLDGLDIALCNFERVKDKWKYKIVKAETFSYENEWRKKLSEAYNLHGLQLLKLHKEYGNYIGNKVKHFVGREYKAEFIASHGHTVFHQPSIGLTFQLGDGNAIAAISNISTVSDFRSLDVALNGQGAPLVPIGDELLFNDYEFCLNLGGFANISNRINGVRLACDLCPANIIINRLASKAGLLFDKDGLVAKRGLVNKFLFDKLEGLEFYTIKGPKSLGKEWLDAKFMPLLESSVLSVEDQLRTVYEHIASQITNYSADIPAGKMLITGGGAFNKFLIQLLKDKSKHRLVIPDNQLVKFKEALVFAFLGLLRVRGEVNCLSSVTGATKDSCSGVIHMIE